jgi:hypothetical protein
MIHPIPSRTFHDKGSVNTVLAMLNSEDLMPESHARYLSSGSAAAVAVPRAQSKIEAIGTRANETPLTNALLPGARSDTVIEDWDELFDAVTARLRLITAERLAATTGSPSDEADRIRARVLECAEALEQLHAALKDELGQRPQP